MFALIKRFLSLAMLPKIWNNVRVSIQSTGFEAEGRKKLKKEINGILDIYRLLIITMVPDTINASGEN